MPDLVVVDTHALLWWFEDRSKLGDNAHESIEHAAEVVVSALTFWEIAMLVEKQRIELDRPVSRWRHELLRSPRFTEATVDGSIGVSAAQLTDFHGDPADRIIVATAIAISAPLVTKDAKITAWGSGNDAPIIW